MPKLWNTTIDTHRQAVRDAVLDAIGTLVEQKGIGGVTMSDVALGAGISRATLYKYFADVDTALLAWHERQVEQHLTHLEAARASAPDALAGLLAVLTAYTRLQRGSHEAGVPSFLHQRSNMAPAHHRLLHLVRDCIADAAAAGGLRTDYSATELTQYCLGTLSGAGLPASSSGRERYLELVLDGLGVLAPDKR
ncbi:AcrR family transcriptional regulator [Devosia sp. UYZn731]|uniref:TetR/AcrR family transcriptional regulator n=1 Tax=Devosia sp. UYZn731 TaxID=3156345 RepID=UPI0033910D5F